MAPRVLEFTQFVAVELFDHMPTLNNYLLSRARHKALVEAAGHANYQPMAVVSVGSIGVSVMPSQQMIHATWDLQVENLTWSYIGDPNEGRKRTHLRLVK